MINKSFGDAIDLRSVAIAAGLTVISMAAIMLLLTLLGPEWTKYAAASCTTTRCFCELPRPGALIVQPANSWSSYGYTLGGFLMIILSQGRGWTSAFPRHAASLFGVTAIFVGLGSALLHATLTLWGQFFDVMGMYLVSTFMLVSALARWRNFSARQALLLYLAVVGGLLAILYAMPEVRRWLFAVVLLLAIGLEMGFARPLRNEARTRYYLAGIIATAVAFIIWNLDQHGTLCAPASLFQGHALWHLLGAASLWCTFLYYRSERRRVEPVRT